MMIKNQINLFIESLLKVITFLQIKRIPTLNDGYYTVLGLFAVKKEDIIFCTDTRCEDELICHLKMQ